MLQRRVQMIQVGMAVALFAAAGAAGVAQTTTATTAPVKTDAGPVTGVIAGDVAAYKGIPFAAPPVGDLRWKAPQPVKPWTAVLAADHYAADCMQKPFGGDAAPLGTPPAEDCLYLNVWTPAARSAAKLPVMVWIYGGGFVNGGSSPAVYDGSQFAKHGIVFVSFNYRLGRFGFFAHPALSAEGKGGPLGNYGFMDAIAAMKWVKNNVAAFGGDPANVTAFGESAGGMMMHMLLTSPAAKGLVHKAIIESGGGRNGIFPARKVQEDTPNGPTSAESVGIAFAKSVGIEGNDAAALAALRKVPADQVIAGLNLASMGAPAAATYAGGPMIDGQIMVETAEDAYRAGHNAKVPLIVGANSLDIGFSFAKNMDEVMAKFGADKDKALAAYDPDKSGDLRSVGYKVAMDAMMVEPARFLAKTFAAQGLPAYLYRFSYVADSLRAQTPGAPHATE